MAERAEGRARMHASVHGMVQGVGFRAFVQREAARLDVTGWVANRPDGTVEVVAEGRREALDRLANSLRRGPRLAEVEDVRLAYEDAAGDFSGFHVRY